MKQCRIYITCLKSSRQTTPALILNIIRASQQQCLHIPPILLFSQRHLFFPVNLRRLTHMYTQYSQVIIWQGEESLIFLLDKNSNYMETGTDPRERKNTFSSIIPYFSCKIDLYIWSIELVQWIFLIRGPLYDEITNKFIKQIINNTRNISTNNI